MNQGDLAPIQQQVERNQRAGWSWCLLRPDQMGGLLEDYQEMRLRLERIAALVQEARCELADHHIYPGNGHNVRETLGEIERLART